MSPIAVSVKIAAAMVDVSETTIREAINTKALTAFRVGRSIRIHLTELEAWTKSLTIVGSEEDR